MALASIKPTDAISNISGWAEIVGLTGLANQLATPTADKLAFAIGAAAIAAVATGVFFWILGFHRQNKPQLRGNPEDQLMLVENKRFSDEGRLLDGYYYKNCDFHNITLQFNGGSYTIDGGTFTGTVRVVSTNNAVVAAYDLLFSLQTYGLKAIPDNTKIERDRAGNVNVTVKIPDTPKTSEKA